jgi:hypothetical protein
MSGDELAAEGLDCQVHSTPLNSGAADLIAAGRVRLATTSAADLPAPVPSDLSTAEVLDDLRASP